MIYLFVFSYEIFLIRVMLDMEKSGYITGHTHCLEWHGTTHTVAPPFKSINFFRKLNSWSTFCFFGNPSGNQHGPFEEAHVRTSNPRAEATLSDPNQISASHVQVPRENPAPFLSSALPQLIHPKPSFVIGLILQIAMIKVWEYPNRRHMSQVSYWESFPHFLRLFEPLPPFWSKLFESPDCLSLLLISAVYGADGGLSELCGAQETALMWLPLRLVVYRQSAVASCFSRRSSLVKRFRNTALKTTPLTPALAPLPRSTYIIRTLYAGTDLYINIEIKRASSGLSLVNSSSELYRDEAIGWLYQPFLEPSVFISSTTMK